MDWTRHHTAGHQVAITAETNEQVDQLNAAIQTRRRDIGDLDLSQTVERGGLTR